MNNKWDYIGTIFAILGIILNAQKIIWCWPMWLLSNVFFAIHFIPKKEWVFLFLIFVYTILDAWAWVMWLK